MPNANSQCRRTKVSKSGALTCVQYAVSLYMYKNTSGRPCRLPSSPSTSKTGSTSWIFRALHLSRNGRGCRRTSKRISRKLLDIFSECNVQVTCFFLGWVGERFPQLVKEAAARGHEIASHGYGHKLVFQQSRDQFHEDVRRARLLLEDIAGAPVVGISRSRLFDYRRHAMVLRSADRRGIPV